MSRSADDLLPVSTHLFVYGTLRRGYRGEMQALLERRAEFVDTALFRGRLFLVDDYPGAIPSSKPDDIVHGDVFRLRDPALVLAELDAYERCGAEGSGSEYYRKQAAVRLSSGRRIDAWIYLYGRPTLALRPIPCGDYLRCVRLLG